MPRTARIVIPNVPHHIIQRGNRRQDVFFDDQDRRIYLSLLRDKLKEQGTTLLAYCLMPNHVHLIVRPADEGGLRIIGEIHRLYTRHINRKMDWQGYLWQGRFGSYPMDESYFYNALRYVELNPVFAGLAESPERYPWSSARQRVQGGNNTDLKVTSAQRMIDDWHAYWQEGLRKHQIMKDIEENTFQLKPRIKIARGTQ